MKVRTAGNARRGMSDDEHYLLVKTGKTIGDYGLVERNDRILVAISGGPASCAMLHLLVLHRRRFAGDFDIVPLHVSTRGVAAARKAEAVARRLGLPLETVGPPKSLSHPPRKGESKAAADCRRIGYFLRRRAALLGCNKLALGHTLDDLVRLFLHRMLNEARLSAIAPAERGRDGLVVIRPVIEVSTVILDRLCRQLGIEHSNNDDGRPDGAVEWLLTVMSRHNPRLERSFLASLKNVRITHLMLPQRQR